jgi:hypothetical protein
MFRNFFILIFVLVLPLTLTACGRGGIPPTQEEIGDNIDAVEDLLEEVNEEYKVRGSCDTIGSSSHCLDYVGSFWTEEQMTLNCQGAGTFKKTTCPYSTNGGCRAGGGTMVETIVWSYDYGGNPITGENVQYETMACNANPVAQWTLPDDLFLD